MKNLMAPNIPVALVLLAVAAVALRTAARRPEPPEAPGTGPAPVAVRAGLLGRHLRGRRIGLERHALPRALHDHRSPDRHLEQLHSKPGSPEYEADPHCIGQTER